VEPTSQQVLFNGTMAYMLILAYGSWRL